METKEPEEILADKPKEQSGWELLRFAIIALLIMVPIRIFIIQPFVVSGSSMFPTFQNGNYLIVDEISYKLGAPQRDDVIVFRYPNDTKKFFIKRIIGLPGETVEVKNDTVTIYNEQNPGGIKMEEPYANLDGACTKTVPEVKLKLKSEEYFVMGDNRYCSSDSRYWGPVPKNLLIGRALVRLWPIKNINIFPGKYEQANAN